MRLAVSLKAHSKPFAYCLTLSITNIVKVRFI